MSMLMRRDEVGSSMEDGGSCLGGLRRLCIRELRIDIGHTVRGAVEWD